MPTPEPGVAYTSGGVDDMTQDVLDRQAVDAAAEVTQAELDTIAATKGLPVGLTGATQATRYVGATTSGAPVSGTFAVGDFIIDRTGKVYVCTTAGSPGSWTLASGTSDAVTAHGATGSTETFDVNAAPVHTATLDANCTATFTAPADATRAYTLTLVLLQDATGSRTMTWPASVKWPAGVAPTLTTTASRKDIFTFETHDGGTTWHGFTSGQNYV